MRQFTSIFATAFLTLALFTSSVSAAKAYQVTGVITKLTEKIITIQKPNEEVWEIDRDTDTKITGELKVGSKVTIEYKMTASKIEVKPEAAK